MNKIPKKKSQYKAMFLALFLGIFGVHQFYLGHTKKGVVYLLLCWTTIPFFLGVFDFLRISFMRFKMFDYVYNDIPYPEMQADNEKLAKALAKGVTKGIIKSVSGVIEK